MESRLRAFAHRHRLPAKRLVTGLVRVLPGSAGRRLRALAEQVAFRVRPEYQGDTLPPIFHFWSGRFLHPVLQDHGIGSPESFYLQKILGTQAAGPILRVVSYGAGSCALELDIAEALRDRGVAFEMTCVDFNEAQLQRASAGAASRGLLPAVRFLAADCNAIADPPAADVILVNQFFHHVEDLESFTAALRGSLATEGRILSCDVVGRNGHAPWPSVAREVDRAWSRLPPAKRFDRYHGRATDRYIPVDHSSYSNEGVRAQDVVERLLEHFDFEVFLTFGAAVMPFIERRIGFNFDPECDEDRDFIREVQQADAEALASHRYPASNMIASIRHKGMAPEPVFFPVPPEAHAVLTQRELGVLERGRRGEKEVEPG